VSEKPELNKRPGKTQFSQQVGDMAARKLQAQAHVTKTVWSGLGMMGLVGWSVVMPTLLGAALGLWLDERYPGEHSWTLALLAIGLGLGCFNAWRWIAREDIEIHRDEINNNQRKISEGPKKVDENKHD
tara:strand:+ start:47042 stop:47428 length:387 start_codon:yes stop_codon:yes gene_type:complete